MTSHNYRWALGLTLAFLHINVGSAATSADPLTARLDAVLKRAIDEHRIVGTVVIVAENGKVVYQRAAGFADREAHRPMRETDIFRLASMTKPIVSSAIMELIQQGKLKLEDPITHWIPYFHPRLPNGESPVITIKQLLTHTAGLSYGVKDHSDVQTPGITMDERLQRIADLPLIYSPGTQWSYSYAIDVLGGVVAKVTGLSLADAVRLLVTDPLKMKDTGFTVSDRSRLTTQYANGYAVIEHAAEPVRASEHQDVHALGVFGPDDFTLTPLTILSHEQFPSGGGGMAATAGDYMKFLESLRMGDSKVLNQSTVASMMTNQIGDLQSPTLGSGWGFGFGGAVLKNSSEAKTPQLPHTWFWAGASGTSFFVDPASKISVVALTNTTPEGGSGPYTLEVRDAIYGKTAP